MVKTVPPLIDVQELVVERGEGRILHGLDWRVERGQHWVILGANGSGKTSLLMALTGYLMPTSGDISVLGRTFGESDWRELRREVGIVSSNLRQRIEDTESAREVVASGKYAMLNFWGTLTRRDKTEAAAMTRVITVKSASIEATSWLRNVQVDGCHQRAAVVGAGATNSASAAAAAGDCSAISSPA